LDTTAGRDGDRLIEPREAAKLFGVTSKTLGRWRKRGLIGAQETLGGRFRYWESEVCARAAEKAVA
jgi:predicted site-specific integrase-resolvase